MKHLLEMKVNILLEKTEIRAVMKSSFLSLLAEKINERSQNGLKESALSLTTSSKWPAYFKHHRASVENDSRSGRSETT